MRYYAFFRSTMSLSVGELTICDNTVCRKHDFAYHLKTKRGMNLRQTQKPPQIYS